MSELLPCPFCGWTDTFIEKHQPGDFVSIVCDLCYAKSKIMPTMSDAQKAWNRRAKPEVAGWQPIETAPKDELIFVYGPEGRDLCWFDDVCDEWRTNDGQHIMITPTHWMPLPEPPKEA